MRIAENIKRLRRARDITQDDLAELLSVTPQAVSKWEQNGSLPDISMLPALAETLDCTVDELLGMDEIRSGEIKKIIAKFEGTPIEEVLRDYAEFMDAVRRHPTNVPLLRCALPVLACLAQSLHSGNLDVIEGDKTRADEVRDFAVTCAGRLLKYSGELEHIMLAYYWLIVMHCEWGDFDKAEEIALKFPEDSAISRYTRAARLTEVRFRQGDIDGELKYRCAEMHDTISALSWQLQFLALAYFRAGKLDDAITVAKVREDLVPLIFPGETFVFPFNVPHLHSDLAWFYIQLGDGENALAYLEKHVDFCLRQQNAFVQPHTPKTPLMKYHSVTWTSQLHDWGVRAELEQVLGDPRYDELRTDPRFAALVERTAREGK
jgi:transcriptional regulator with XRE-family HTH domain